MAVEGLAELLLTALGLAAGVAVGAATVLEQCRARETCIASRRCVPLNRLVGCGFVTVADSAAASDYVVNPTCAPGEHFDFATGACALLRPYPDALNREAFGAADSASASERACGGWMRAREVQQVETMAAATHAAFQLSAEDALVDLSLRHRLPASNLARAVHRCVHEASGGAVEASARAAYVELRARVDAALAGAAAGRWARAAGALAGGGCSTGPAYVAYGLFSTGIQLTVDDNVLLLRSGLDTALARMGESEATQQAALAAHDLMQEQRRQVVLQSDVNGFLEGLYWDEPVPEQRSALPVAYTPSTYGLPQFLDVDAAGGDARALLLGAAAQCAQALPAMLPSTQTPVLSSRGSRQWARRARKKLPPAYLRVRLPEEASNEQKLHALSRAGARGIEVVAYELTSTSTLASTESDCVAASKSFFTEEADAVHFEQTVGAALYARLETLTSNVRAAVLAGIDGAVARSAFNATDDMRSCVASTFLRIPGAPRQTWAGRTVAAPYIAMRSNQTFFEIVVAQAHALLLERVTGLLRSERGFEEYWTDVGETLQRNALIYPMAEHGQMVVFLGMLQPPYAHPQYSDASLEARLGSVIAHEFAHCTVRARARALGERRPLTTDCARAVLASAADVVVGARRRAAAPLRRQHVHGGDGRRRGRRLARGRGPRALGGLAAALGTELVRAAAGRLPRDRRRGAPVAAAPRGRTCRHTGRFSGERFAITCVKRRTGGPGARAAMRAAKGYVHPRELRYAAASIGAASEGSRKLAAGEGHGPCNELNCVPWLVSLQSWRASPKANNCGLELVWIYTVIGIHVGAWLTAITMSILVVQRANDDATPEDPAEFVSLGSLLTISIAFLVLAGFWGTQFAVCCFGKIEGGFSKQRYGEQAMFPIVLISFISSGIQASIFFDGIAFLSSNLMQLQTKNSAASQDVKDVRAFTVVAVVFKFFLLSIQNSLQTFVAELEKPPMAMPMTSSTAALLPADA
jgi:hypothetical protein